MISLEHSQSLTAEWLQDNINSEKDDVICPEFTKGIIIAAENGGPVEIAAGAKEVLKSWGNTWSATLDIAVSAGPYLYWGEDLWQVGRLYDDTQGAFSIPLRPRCDDDGGCFEILDDGICGW